MFAFVGCYDKCSAAGMVAMFRTYRCGYNAEVQILCQKLVIMFTFPRRSDNVTDLYVSDAVLEVYTKKV